MDTEIFIIGRDFLANELLSHFLSEKLPNCRLQTLSKLDNFYHSITLGAAQQTLLLCDCKSYPPSYFLSQLQTFFLQRSCQTRSLFYNLAHDVELETKFLRRGVQGIVFADDKPDTFISAINKVLSDQLWASRQAMSECLRTHSKPIEDKIESTANNLTPRECQILKLIVDGSSNESIAENLCISSHTVKTHLYNVFRKINVPNRMKAARWAEQNLPIS